jgi:serine phosphatase RsbU (regulator of sigma subunit)
MRDSLPADAGVTVHVEYLPAFDVGGDFYSITQADDGTIAVAIGDVAGKGVAAALVMSRVSADIQRALVAGNAPASVLRKINARLSDVESESFVTATCIRLDPERRTLTVANAGHLPLVIRRVDGTVLTCGEPSGTPLGMLPSDYEEQELRLEPSDVVLLFTDGLVDALDFPSGRMGMNLLLALVREAPHDARQISERIRAAVDAVRSRKLVDDVTCVALQLAP